MKIFKFLLLVFVMLLSSANVYLANHSHKATSELSVEDIESEGLGEVAYYILDKIIGHYVDKGLDYLDSIIFGKDGNTYLKKSGSPYTAKREDGSVEYIYTLQDYDCASGGERHICDIPSHETHVENCVQTSWP